MLFFSFLLLLQSGVVKKGIASARGRCSKKVCVLVIRGGNRNGICISQVVKRGVKSCVVNWAVNFVSRESSVVKNSRAWCRAYPKKKRGLCALPR